MGRTLACPCVFTCCFVVGPWAYLLNVINILQSPWLDHLVDLKCASSHAQIISNATNGVDVDKWDYFLRDSKHLNLSVSFDHNRLLATCRVLEVAGRHPESGKQHIAFRDKDVANVWDMFQVRAQLHSKAYQHPVVKILEQMQAHTYIYMQTLLLKKLKSFLLRKRMSESRDILPF